MVLERQSHQLRTFAPYRLPSGRDRIPADQVAENQRWRLLGAASEVLLERGYAEIKSSDIVSRAGVSSSTFYVYFDNVGDGLLAANQAAEIAADSLRAASERAPPSPPPSP